MSVVTLIREDLNEARAHLAALESLWVAYLRAYPHAVDDARTCGYDAQPCAHEDLCREAAPWCQREHDAEQRHVCTHCSPPKAFEDKRGWSAHQRVHNPARLCPECVQPYDERGLVRHLRQSHTYTAGAAVDAAAQAAPVDRTPRPAAPRTRVDKAPQRPVEAREPVEGPTGAPRKAQARTDHERAQAIIDAAIARRRGGGS